MDIKKLKNSIEVLKDQLDGALLASDIWITGTGQSIAGYNPNPQATALFERVTEYINKALEGSSFPVLNEYYMLKLEGDVTVLILLFEKYQWGMLVDSSKIQLGLLLNVALPSARKEFLGAIAEEKE